MLGSVAGGVPILASKSLRRRRIVMPLIAAIVVGVIVAILWHSGGQTQLVGSGSTAAQPLINQAAVAFRNAQSADNPDRAARTGGDWVLDGEGIVYEPVGSLGGIMRLSEREVDFAVSDYPLSSGALDERGAVQFPIAVAAIAVVHNLELSEDRRLRLDAPTISAIYRGKIERWNDPAIAHLNPGLGLPDRVIAPLFRSDGSGSTYGLSSYLSAGDPEWADLGSGTTIAWPTGTGVERSSGMVDAITQTGGAFGYVEAGQAQRAGLAIVELANASGTFVGPSPEAMSAAISDTNWSAGDGFASSAPTATAADAYPMTVTIHALLEREKTSDTGRALEFLSFLMDSHDLEAADLGYLPLPADATSAVHAFWNDTFGYAV